MKSLAILSIFGFALSSCIIPQSNHVVPKYYLLVSSYEDSNSSQSDSGLSFYLNEVRLSQYLQDNRLVYRPTSEIIEFRENERWGEPLEEGICRIVGKNLSQLMRTLNYGVYPHRKKFNIDREIEITVDRFEKISRKDVRLKAFWEIRQKEGQPSRFSYDEIFPILEPTTKGEIRALSQAIFGLSKKIQENI